MAEIKVFLVDDDPEWLKAMTLFMKSEKDILLVGSVENQESALHFVSTMDIDVILMDINLTDNNLDGVELAAEVHLIKPDAKIIMLTSLNQADVILDSFTFGAVNFISKARYQDIPQAIRDAYCDESTIHSTAAGVLLKDFAKMKQEQQRNKLTQMEKEILELRNDGMKISEIAQSKFIAERTVKFHLKNIKDKFGVTSMQEVLKKLKWLRFF